MAIRLSFRRVAIGLIFLVQLALFAFIATSYSSSSTTETPSQKHAIAKRSYSHDPSHQNLQISPAIPIIGLSSQYISNISASSQHSRRKLGPNGAEICSSTETCADGSCCSKDGICGFGPTYCGAGNCTSNCDAKAMCGRYSDDGGTIPCGMNLCCSYYGWCGTDELHCGNPDPHGQTPCQEGFGLCHTVPPPSCGVGSGSTNGRAIGYYQASNVRDRVCNRVEPNQIDTAPYTHLNFAFARFDPGSWQIVPNDAGDVPLYSQFTALKSSKLQTWIAIGGFDFSDPGTSTHTAWSNMTSSASSRSTFISSLQSFMAKYGFQGVDIDWEYPSTPERGGQRADMQNFVSLVREMRSAFGSTYGISLTLAPDYWYLRGFDAKAMEPYVDFFGFMAYDLHGFWDADVRTLGSEVRGQTDIRDISNDTLPLWFDALTPSKINFGVAYYGRGYTLADPSCDHLLCPFSGPSKPGPCTNFPGVLSLREIQEIITEKGITPTLLQDSMMKQIVYDGQWMGYDDDETIKMKKAWADGQCFGGTMAWSVDFRVLGSGDTPPVTTDGTCGPAHGTICGNWADGSCCSSSGYCGSDAAHCGNGCQSGFGNCTSGLQTTDGTCGAQNNNAFCGDFHNGACCSAAGYCGNSTDHCGSGCQSGCPTTDGTCGAKNNHNTCVGWSQGECCSSDGFCGSSAAHCGSGCQNGPCTSGGVTTDGTCGIAHGNTTCGNWAQGNCCSSSGFCGSDAAHCGSGCQSGNCVGSTTTDGTCGIAHGNTTCFGWAQGDCCSSSGYCGSDDAHCGVGCQSGSCEGSGIVILDPSIYDDPDPTVACFPPCTFVFPDWTLTGLTTIQPPPLTETWEVRWSEGFTSTNGVTGVTTIVSTTTTTIVLPPIITSVIPVWNVNWTDTRTSTLYLTSSLTQPPTTLSEGSHVVTNTQKSSTTLVGGYYTYSPDPYPPIPTPRPGPPPPPPPPPPPYKPSVHVTRGPPTPTCTSGPKCPKPCKGPHCHPKPPCTTCGCIGPGCSEGGDCVDCEDEDCETKTTVTDCDVECLVTSYTDTMKTNCYTTTCSEITACDITGTTTTSASTTAPACSGGIMTYDDDQSQDGAFSDYHKPSGGNNPSTTQSPTGTITSAPSFVTDCTHHMSDDTYTTDFCVCTGRTVPASENRNVSPPNYCAYTSPPYNTFNPSVTAFDPHCTHQNADPGLGYTSGFCVCTGRTVSESINTAVTPANSCAYTSPPYNTIPPATTTAQVTTDTARCEVCTAQPNGNDICNKLPNCTPQPTTTHTPAPSQTPGVTSGKEYNCEGVPDKQDDVNQCRSQDEGMCTLAFVCEEKPEQKDFDGEITIYNNTCGCMNSFEEYGFASNGGESAFDFTIPLVGKGAAYDVVVTWSQCGSNEIHFDYAGQHFDEKGCFCENDPTGGLTARSSCRCPFPC